eukprot:8529595-Lingulodinium_polyedra.AAC.1
MSARLLRAHSHYTAPGRPSLGCRLENCPRQQLTFRLCLAEMQIPRALEEQGLRTARIMITADLGAAP